MTGTTGQAAARGAQNTTAWAIRGARCGALLLLAAVHGSDAYAFAPASGMLARSKPMHRGRVSLRLPDGSMRRRTLTLVAQAGAPEIALQASQAAGQTTSVLSGTAGSVQVPADVVAQQLFRTLVLQLARWYALKVEGAGPEELLDAVSGGLVSQARL